MIKLNESHKDEFLKFVEVNPTLNLFYMGDYLAYGFDDPICSYFGIFRDGNLAVCCMVYRTSLHVSGDYVNDEETQEIYDLYKTHKCDNFTTSKNFFGLLENFPNPMKLEICELSVYQEPYKPNLTFNNVEILDMADAGEFIKVRAKIFSTPLETSDFIEEHSSGKSISYCVKDDGKIVSVATVTALTPDAAMIVGVGTLDDYRQQGLATACMLTLCNDMKSSGRETVLFYTNPLAGAMYHKLGFVDQEPYYLAKELIIIKN